MFEVVYGEIKQHYSIYRLQENINGDGDHQNFKWRLLEEPSLDNPDDWVKGVGKEGGELFSESFSYFSVVVERSGGKGDELVRRDIGFLPKRI